MKRTIASLLASLTALIAPDAAHADSSARKAIAEQVQTQLRGFTQVTQADIYMAIEQTDIDGNAVPDWQVDWTQLGPRWCGTGGCRFQLWHGRAQGKPKLVFDRQARERSVEQRGNRMVFVFDFHGSECGGFGSQACPGEFAWDPKARAMVLLPTPARHTAVEEPLIFGR